MIKQFVVDIPNVLTIVNKNDLWNYQTWVCVKALNLLIGAIALRVPFAGDVQQSG